MIKYLYKEMAYVILDWLCHCGQQYGNDASLSFSIELQYARRGVIVSGSSLIVQGVIYHITTYATFPAVMKYRVGNEALAIYPA